MMNFKRIVITASVVLAGMMTSPAMGAYANSWQNQHHSIPNSMMNNHHSKSGNGMRGGNGMMGNGEQNSTTKSQSSTPKSQTSNTKTNTGKKGWGQVVRVVATDWKWTLNKHRFTLGKPIKFIVTSTAGTHGFSVSGTNISVAVSQGNQVKTVIWKPKKKGTYSIICDIYCGPGHSAMISSFKVT